MDVVAPLVVGTRYRVRGNRAMALAVVGQPMVELTDGTTLELASVDEDWDHAHASIFSIASIAADLRVLDGPMIGATVRVTYREEVNPTRGEHRRTGFPPFWLVRLVRPQD